VNELDRLHEIIDNLPPQRVHALLTLLEPPQSIPQSINDEEFARLLADVPDEDVDAETAARILAAESEPGETISHEELKRRLGRDAELSLSTCCSARAGPYGQLRGHTCRPRFGDLRRLWPRRRQGIEGGR
jgi:hypothetical protein